MHVELDEVYDGLRRLQQIPGLLVEAIPLATCGRMEVYCLSPHPRRVIRVLKGLVSARTSIPHGELEAHTYLYRGEEAARHLFRVAAGLDSVVYGEAQILGQVREAMLHPSSAETGGGFLMRLFQSALTAGKRVRSETSIGRGAASVAGAALCLLEAQAGTFEGKTALVLGAGDTGALVARLLRKHGMSRILVANRTLGRAEELATEVDGEAFDLSGLPDLVSRADVLVGAVTGRDDLITPEMFASGAVSPGRRRYVIDLAHPRNFSPEIEDVDGVQLMDLARIFEQVEEAKLARQEQVPRAEIIVEAEVENFIQWARSRKSGPILRAVREQILALAHEEAERRARGKSPEEREALTRFARSLARTLLHAPTLAIRKADPSTPEGRWLIDAAPSLFGIEAPDDSLKGGVL
jgi:glutamyl-tRNA reductase